MRTRRIGRARSGLRRRLRAILRRLFGIGCGAARSRPAVFPLTTLLCFLPFGVVAIVKASSVATHWYAGNPTEAHAAAESAKNWSIAAAVTGVILAIVVVAAGGYR